MESVLGRARGLNFNVAPAGGQTLLLQVHMSANLERLAVVSHLRGIDTSVEPVCPESPPLQTIPAQTQPHEPPEKNEIAGMVSKFFHQMSTQCYIGWAFGGRIRIPTWCVLRFQPMML